MFGVSRQRSSAVVSSSKGVEKARLSTFEKWRANTSKWYDFIQVPSNKAEKSRVAYMKGTRPAFLGRGH